MFIGSYIIYSYIIYIQCFLFVLFPYSFMVSIFCVRLPAAFCIWYQKGVLQNISSMIIRYQFLSLQYIKKAQGQKPNFLKYVFFRQGQKPNFLKYVFFRQGQKPNFRLISCIIQCLFLLIGVLFPKVCVKIMRKVPFLWVYVIRKVPFLWVYVIRKVPFLCLV